MSDATAAPHAAQALMQLAAHPNAADAFVSSGAVSLLLKKLEVDSEVQEQTTKTLARMVRCDQSGEIARMVNAAEGQKLTVAAMFYEVRRSTTRNCSEEHRRLLCGGLSLLAALCNTMKTAAAPAPEEDTLTPRDKKEDDTELRDVADVVVKTLEVHE